MVTRILTTALLATSALWAVGCGSGSGRDGATRRNDAPQTKIWSESSYKIIPNIDDTKDILTHEQEAIRAYEQYRNALVEGDSQRAWDMLSVTFRARTGIRSYAEYKELYELRIDQIKAVNNDMKAVHAAVDPNSLEASVVVRAPRGREKMLVMVKERGVWKIDSNYFPAIR